MIAARVFQNLVATPPVQLTKCRVGFDSDYRPTQRPIKSADRQVIWPRRTDFDKDPGVLPREKALPDNSVHLTFGVVYSFFTNHPAFPFWTPKWLASYTQLSPFATCMELYSITRKQRSTRSSLRSTVVTTRPRPDSWRNIAITPTTRS